MSALNSSDSPAIKPGRGAIRAPRGVAISCRGWRQEGVLRMLMNCMDRDVAEAPEELVIHGRVRAARDWESFEGITSSLRALEGDQTLTIKDGKPTGISTASLFEPRVILENPDWGDERAPDGWAYVGSQAALPLTYEAFAGAAREHFDGTLAGRLAMAGGLGGVGGALPLAATLNGAAFLGIDADPERIKRRVKGGYCDVMVNDLDEALRILKNAVRKREAASVGLIGNCANVIPELAERGIVPDLVTDLTSADDVANGYVPSGLTAEQAARLRVQDPDACRARSLDSVAVHAQGLLDLRKLGSIAFDFGNGLTVIARNHGVDGAAEMPSASRYLQSLRDRGYGIVTLIALSGEPRDVGQIDRLLADLFPADDGLRGWIALASKHVRYQGLPARTCWLTADQVQGLARVLNEHVANGKLQCPVVVASPSGLLEHPAWVWRSDGGRAGQAAVLDGER